MTFKQYLQAIESGDVANWVLKNMTSNTKFSKYKVNSILTEAFSEGYCPMDEFKVYRNPDELVFGQFIALENAITKTTVLQNKLLSMAQNILRPFDDEVFDNTDTDKELEHIENILNHPVQNILRVINKYAEQREEYINKKYAGVFYKSKSEDDDGQEEEKDQNVFNNEDSSWYWYSLIRTLSGENIHEYEKTMMLPMSVVSPEVAYLRKEEQKREYERKVEEVKRKARHGHY